MSSPVSKARRRLMRSQAELLSVSDAPARSRASAVTRIQSFIDSVSWPAAVLIFSCSQAGTSTSRCFNPAAVVGFDIRHLRFWVELADRGEKRIGTNMRPCAIREIYGCSALGAISDAKSAIRKVGLPIPPISPAHARGRNEGPTQT